MGAKLDGGLRGDSRVAEIAFKRAPLPGASIREKLRTQDDAEVVSAFLGGEERAFKELVERYQTRLLNFIFRTIGDREKAEDLVQEVFIRVYRHIRSEEHTSELQSRVDLVCRLLLEKKNKKHKV